jgi:hypothetical protein
MLAKAQNIAKTKLSKPRYLSLTHPIRQLDGILSADACKID